MKRFSVTVAAAFLVFSCGGDDDDPPAKALVKAAVDFTALEAGIEVQVCETTTTGTVTLPLTKAIPSEAELASKIAGYKTDKVTYVQSVLAQHVTLMVKSPRTNVTAYLNGDPASTAEGGDPAKGMLVGEMPDEAGEYTWTVADDRKSVTLTFYNEVPTSGLALKPALAYDTSLGISANAIFETLVEVAFTANVVAGCP
jgi:hypothetical protein